MLEEMNVKVGVNGSGQANRLICPRCFLSVDDHALIQVSAIHSIEFLTYFVDGRRVSGYQHISLLPQNTQSLTCYCSHFICVAVSVSA